MVAVDGLRSRHAAGTAVGTARAFGLLVAVEAFAVLVRCGFARLGDSVRIMAGAAPEAVSANGFPAACLQLLDIAGIEIFFGHVGRNKVRHEIAEGITRAEHRNGSGRAS